MFWVNTLQYIARIRLARNSLPRDRLEKLAAKAVSEIKALEEVQGISGSNLKPFDFFAYLKALTLKQLRELKVKIGQIKGVELCVLHIEGIDKKFLN